jgi:ribosome-binding factor A
MSHRSEQVASVLKRAVQKIIDRKLSDPRLKGDVTITKLSVDTELTFAKVLVTISPESAERVTLQGLRAASGHVRKLLRDEVEMRRIPQIDFRLDEGLKKERDVLAAIDEAVKDLPEDTPDQSGGDHDLEKGTEQ